MNALERNLSTLQSYYEMHRRNTAVATTTLMTLSTVGLGAILSESSPLHLAQSVKNIVMASLFGALSFAVTSLIAHFRASKSGVLAMDDIRRGKYDVGNRRWRNHKLLFRLMDHTLEVAFILIIIAIVATAASAFADSSRSFNRGDIGKPPFPSDTGQASSSEESAAIAYFSDEGPRTLVIIGGEPNFTVVRSSINQSIFDIETSRHEPVSIVAIPGLSSCVVLSKSQDRTVLSFIGDTVGTSADMAPGSRQSPETHAC